MKSHILVAGGAGYIGSHTVRALVKSGFKVTVLDSLEHGHRAAIVDQGVDLVVSDMGDAEAMEELFSSNSFDAVINFAGYVNVGESVKDPLKYYHNNVGNSVIFLQAMQNAGVKNLVFSSTCATYGVIDTLPISEQESQAPINSYGRSKLMFEHILNDCETAWGLKSVCLRYFNACGASQDSLIGEDHTPETHLIPLVLQAAKGIRENITVFGTDYPTPDGTCIRDYVHVNDLADAHIKAVERLLDGGESLKCNLGTGQGFSVNEIIQVAKRITECDIPVVYGERREGDPPELVANPTLANTELQWTPQSSSIENIVQTAWNWMQNNDGRYPSTRPSFHKAHGGIFS